MRGEKVEETSLGLFFLLAWHKLCPFSHVIIIPFFCVNSNLKLYHIFLAQFCQVHWTKSRKNFNFIRRFQVHGYCGVVKKALEKESLLPWENSKPWPCSLSIYHSPLVLKCNGIPFSAKISHVDWVQQAFSVRFCFLIILHFVKDKKVLFA